MNIIIPIGGLGKRFSDFGYDLPKPLVRTLGEHLIIECINSLKTSSDDIIYIVYRTELDRYNFSDLVKFKFPKSKFRFIPINFDTRGAAETVLQCLTKMDNDALSKLTIVLDSDNLYKDDVIKVSKERNDNLIFYHITNIEKPIYSYINIDDSDRVLDIKEKVKISQNACIGAYCFKSALELRDNIMNIIKDDIKTSNEFYISNVYKYLLDSNKNITSYKVENYICLGTPEQLKIHSSTISKGKKLKLCFDLDNTLVTYPEKFGDYSTVKPIEKNISYLRFLHSLGHEIIIYTARRMKTHSGNVGKVQADIGETTFATLKKFNIPYTELYFGKPQADFYIDDLAVKAYDDLEKQIGIYNIHPDTRAHNRIVIDNNQIIKYSSDISGEKYWYENIPGSVCKFFPKLISTSSDSITISKVNGIPLSYINTNKTLTKEILYSLLDTLEQIHKSSDTQDTNIYLNYKNKLKERVNNFDFDGYVDFQNVYLDNLTFLEYYEKSNKGICGVVHGDPVFTNVLIDHHNSFFFIDMRGKQLNELTIYGDIFYDYAKIYQSIIGYDFVLAGVELDTNYINKNKQYFDEYIENKFSKSILSNIKNITISLILSLIPIHNNDKCMLYYNLIKNI